MGILQIVEIWIKVPREGDGQGAVSDALSLCEKRSGTRAA